jgi:hypothetical protein
MIATDIATGVFNESIKFRHISLQQVCSGALAAISPHQKTDVVRMMTKHQARWKK